MKQLAEVRVNVRGDAFSTEATTLEITAKRSGSDVSGQLTVDYGDGTERGEGDINGGKELRYTYARPGDYNVTATVAESDGTRSHETTRLAVAEKPRSPTSSNGEDDLDARSVRYLHPNIANWRITLRITNVSISAREICVDHTAAGRFPRSPFGDIQVEGNVWVFARFGGQWVAATYDWLKPGQVCKGVTGDELGVIRFAFRRWTARGVRARVMKSALPSAPAPATTSTLEKNAPTSSSSAGRSGRGREPLLYWSASPVHRTGGAP